jgi:hypothetical protein
MQGTIFFYQDILAVAVTGILVKSARINKIHPTSYGSWSIITSIPVLQYQPFMHFSYSSMITVIEWAEHFPAASYCENISEGFQDLSGI